VAILYVHEIDWSHRDRTHAVRFGSRRSDPLCGRFATVPASASVPSILQKADDIAKVFVLYGNSYNDFFCSMLLRAACLDVDLGDLKLTNGHVWDKI